jgi:hypothetical protein
MATEKVSRAVFRRPARTRLGSMILEADDAKSGDLFPHSEHEGSICQQLMLHFGDRKERLAAPSGLREQNELTVDHADIQCFSV